MSKQESPQTINEVLDRTVEKTGGDTVSLGEILDSLGNRSYGPLFLIIAVVAMIPIIGGIPGMSIVTGTLVMLLAAQLLFLRTHPWLPKKTLSLSFSRDKLTKGVEKARPGAKRIGKIVGRRWEFFTRPPFVNIVALLCIVLAVTFYPLALIPFGVLPPAAAIFVFGLGLTARDGLLILLGLLITAASVWFTIYVWPSSWLPF